MICILESIPKHIGATDISHEKDLVDIIIQFIPKSL